jgi:phosphatidylglycerol---prolipoprotein diacylglyceryl transferase
MPQMITIFRSLFAPPRHLILLIASLWLGLYVSEKRAEQHAISIVELNNSVFYSLVGFFAGGRILFVFANVSAFIHSPLSIFSVNVDLFDPIGALATAILVGLMYGQRHKIPLWSMLDTLTPLFATLAIGISLSNLAAGKAFGSPTNLPWGIVLWNATRHPTQIYELIASVTVFGTIWFRTAASQPGSDFLFFVALTAGTRLFLEAFRGDSTLIPGGIRLVQVIAWFVLAAALFLSEWMNREEKSPLNTGRIPLERRGRIR